MGSLRGLVMGCFGFIASVFVISSITQLTLLVGLWRGDWTTGREEIVDDVVVQASAGRLWEVMMDWNSYDDWSSAVSGLRGSKVPSETFHVTYREFPYLGIPAQVLPLSQS